MWDQSFDLPPENEPKTETEPTATAAFTWSWNSLAETIRKTVSLL